MIQLATAQIEDLDHCLLQPAQIGGISNYRELIAAQLEQSFAAVTIRDDDMVLAIVGIVELHAGCADAWAIVTNSLDNRGLILTTQIRQLIEAVQMQRGLRRLGILVRPDVRKHTVWAKRLGFVTEGTVRNYGPTGEDFLLMSRIWN